MYQVIEWKKDTVEYISNLKRWLLAHINGIQRAIYEGREGSHLKKLEKKLQSELSNVLGF